ncbi:Ig-like domain-containing protein [Aeromicrobium ginsengisoli]|uniref:LPXTG cell wall anchor domain-containing protein n=1 Tax=Aeromicrobium ginsengisoli TaxID=363867 RepID=A0A5M4FAT9_9ACTN|nr:Ig-like domain-containing protein [Aeromicrobium ginsengisoli]KAA1395445.1 hypothetical protein ESP70_014910 [Aeromicrobium ginsengisoli]
MSRSTRPSGFRATTARLAIGGAAGLASLLVVAPAALAEDAPTPDPTETTDPTPTTPTPPTTDEDPGTPGGETTEPTEPTQPTQPTEEAPPTRTPHADIRGGATTSGALKSGSDAAVQVDVEPNFGTQKYRVGVQVADGSYVPAGTTTAGTTITITETGPNVDGGSRTFTCTTAADTQQPGSTATYCHGDVGAPTLAKAKASGVTVTPAIIPTDQMFIAAPGSTVTIQQTTVMPNLLRDTTTATINPCVFSGDGDACPQVGGLSALFNDPGLPPIAVDDKATTREGRAVDIDVLDNDDPVNGAPVSGLAVTSDPSDGTAKVSSGEITYTPDDGFTGTDTFDYRYNTPNGSATATVTVTVRPQEVADADQALPDTGGADPRLFGFGALLLVAGGWLTARGRRPGAHAPTD